MAKRRKSKGKKRKISPIMKKWAEAAKKCAKKGFRVGTKQAVACARKIVKGKSR